MALLDWIGEAPTLLATYSTWVAVAGIFLLSALGWMLCARVRARKARDVELQTERRISKLVEQADRERRAEFLEEKSKWYDTKTGLEREIDQRRRELEKLSEDLQDGRDFGGVVGENPFA